MLTSIWQRQVSWMSQGMFSLSGAPSTPPFGYILLNFHHLGIPRNECPLHSAQCRIQVLGQHSIYYRRQK